MYDLKGKKTKGQSKQWTYQVKCLFAAGKKAVDVASTSFVKGFTIDPKNSFQAVSYDDVSAAVTLTSPFP